MNNWQAAVRIGALGLLATIMIVATNSRGDRSMRGSSVEHESAADHDSLGERRSTARIAEDGTSSGVEPVAAAAVRRASAQPLQSTEVVGPLLASDELPTLPTDRPIGWPTIDEAEQLFALERIDSTWSEQSERVLLGNLSLIPGLAVVHIEVECRNRLCRLKLIFPRGTAPTFAIRKIYALSEGAGLRLVASETELIAGGLVQLRLFLRRNTD